MRSNKNRRLFMLILCLMITSSVIAQLDISKRKTHFAMGLNGGITTGDYKDIYTSNVGFDIIAFYKLSPRFYFGVTTGFAHYIVDNISNENTVSSELDDLQIIPFTASLRASPFKNFLAGIDVGYATTLDSDVSGGFYASPRLTYVVNSKIPIFAGLRTINLDNRLNAFQFGIGYIFF